LTSAIVYRGLSAAIRAASSRNRSVLSRPRCTEVIFALLGVRGLFYRLAAQSTFYAGLGCVRGEPLGVLKGGFEIVIACCYGSGAQLADF
jgi:hypothetical protein